MKNLKILTLLFLLLPQFALALTPLDGTFTYRLAWNGIPMGEAVLDAHQSNSDYLMEMRVKLSGIAKLVAKHKSTTKAEGKTAKNMALAEHTYRSDYTQKKTDKSIALTYAKGGILKTRDITPKDDPNTRPPVPFKDVAAVPDPLTFLHVLRARIDGGETTFSQMLYDGKRLTKVDFKEAGAENGLRKFSIKRTPISGYTAKELRKFSESGERAILAFFSNNEHLTLKEVRMQTTAGWVSATLAES
jgi:hypothetical protein